MHIYVTIHMCMCILMAHAYTYVLVQIRVCTPARPRSMTPRKRGRRARTPGHSRWESTSLCHLPSPPWLVVSVRRYRIIRRMARGTSWHDISCHAMTSHDMSLHITLCCVVLCCVLSAWLMPYHMMLSGTAACHNTPHAITKMRHDASRCGILSHRMSGAVAWPAGAASCGEGGRGRGGLAEVEGARGRRAEEARDGRGSHGERPASPRPHSLQPRFSMLRVINRGPAIIGVHDYTMHLKSALWQRNMFPYVWDVVSFI